MNRIFTFGALRDVWAFGCDSLTHADGRVGMFGVVTPLIVEG